VPIYSDLKAKKTKKRHFLPKIAIFFCFFFAEIVVLLIFAQQITTILFIHITNFNYQLHYEQD